MVTRMTGALVCRQWEEACHAAACSAAAHPPHADHAGFPGFLLLLLLLLPACLPACCCCVCVCSCWSRHACAREGRRVFCFTTGCFRQLLPRHLRPRIACRGRNRDTAESLSSSADMGNTCGCIEPSLACVGPRMSARDASFFFFFSSFDRRGEGASVRQPASGSWVLEKAQQPHTLGPKALIKCGGPPGVSSNSMRLQRSNHSTTTNQSNAVTEVLLLWKLLSHRHASGDTGQPRPPVPPRGP